jgi:release factor glutamine methyltransferase
VLAGANAVRLGLGGRALVVVGDWAEAMAARFDLVVANPPYVERGAIAGLMPEVALFEPASALDGGVDGLEAYRRILPDLPRLLEPGGRAIMEIGAGTAEGVRELARAVGLTVSEVRQDLAGIPRALSLAARVTKKPFGRARQGG